MAVRESVDDNLPICRFRQHRPNCNEHLRHVSRYCPLCIDVSTAIRHICSTCTPHAQTIWHRAWPSLGGSWLDPSLQHSLQPLFGDDNTARKCIGFEDDRRDEENLEE